MEAYFAFSEVYDSLMEDVPYGPWCEKICEVLKEHGIEDGLLLELGCGTGTMTELLASRGYDMTGVDNSVGMLEQAGAKKESSGHDILYLCQDMREFELYGTVRAVVSVCDSINYITDPAELEQVFKLVNNYLDPSGLFIFDFNTVHKYRDIIGDSTIAESREECSFIWDNLYDEEARLNEYSLALFIKGDDGRYDRYDELHLQRAYELEEIKALLEKAGLEFVRAFDTELSTVGGKEEPAGNESGRISVIARERGKEA